MPRTISEIAKARETVEATAEPYEQEQPQSEAERLRAELEAVKAQLAEARKPRNGLGVEDRRRLGWVAPMGSDRYEPVSVYRDTELEHQNFIDKCDNLTLTPRVTILEPGVEPPTLKPWPNIQPGVSPDVPGRWGDPRARNVVDPENDAW